MTRKGTLTPSLSPSNILAVSYFVPNILRFYVISSLIVSLRDKIRSNYSKIYLVTPSQPAYIAIFWLLVPPHCHWTTIPINNIPFSKQFAVGFFRRKVSQFGRSCIHSFIALHSLNLQTSVASKYVWVAIFCKIIAHVTGNRARKWREKFQKSLIHILSCSWALACHSVTIFVYKKQYPITTRTHLLEGRLEDLRIEPWRDVTEVQ